MNDFSKAFQINATNLDEVLEFLNDFTLKSQILIKTNIKEDIYSGAIDQLDLLTIENNIASLNQDMTQSCLEKSTSYLSTKFFQEKKAIPYEASINIIKYQNNYYGILNNQKNLLNFLEKQFWYIPQNFSMKSYKEGLINLEQYNCRNTLWSNIIKDSDINLNCFNKSIYKLNLSCYNNIIKEMKCDDFLKYISSHTDLFEKRIKKQLLLISLNTTPRAKELRNQFNTPIELRGWLEKKLLHIDYNILNLSLEKLSLIQEYKLLDNSIQINNDKLKNIKL